MLIGLIMTAAFAQTRPTKLPAKHRKNGSAPSAAIESLPAQSPAPQRAGATPIPDGKVQDNFPNGKPHFIREYQDGRLLGEITFGASGALEAKKIYDQGRPVSEDEFYENGSLKKSIRRTVGRDGEVEIKIQTFFENGKPSVSGGAQSNSFTDLGVPEGPYQTWNDQGFVLQTGRYHLGLKTGIWKLNLEHALRTEIYDAGRLKRRLDLDIKTKKVIADDRFTDDGALEMPVAPSPPSPPKSGVSSTPAPSHL